MSIPTSLHSVNIIYATVLTAEKYLLSLSSWLPLD